MLNQVLLIGRLAAEPVYATYERNGQEGCRVQYRLAVERDYKNGDVREADFIFCKAFGTEARFAGTYFHQGDLVCVKGRLTTERTNSRDGGEGKIFTCVHIEKNYLLRKKGDTKERSREMNQNQNDRTGTVGEADEGWRNEEFPPFLEGEDEEFPPLPQEEYEQMVVGQDIEVR